GNYYLAGKETLEKRELLKIDYLPTKLFDEGQSENDKEDRAARTDAKDAADAKAPKKEPSKKDQKKAEKERKQDDAIDRKMDKTSQVTLWVDPATQQIVKYT